MADLELEPPWSHVFELMWEAYVVGTIPVGAVVAGSDGSIVAHGRNRIFDRPHSGQLAGTRLAHAEINALLGLSAKRTYPKLTLYSALEPCHLCLAAASASRVGSVHYAARDPYAGAVGKLVSSQDMRLHPLTVEGPLSGPVGLFPELLHLRHMLWRVRDGRGIVPFYRQTRPELVELAQKLPAPPEATTLADAYVLVA